MATGHQELLRQTVEELLSAGHEVRAFETKSSGSIKDKAYVAKVARAVMAMGNLKDGGIVCLGIDDKHLVDMSPGLELQHLAEWSDFDNVSAQLAKYSDPPVTFSLSPLRLSNGVDVVALRVDEFVHTPHICKKAYPGELQDGVIYVRPDRQPESVPVPSSVEMRDLLELAVDRGVQTFVRRGQASGLFNQPSTDSEQAQVDLERYAAEAEQAWSNPSPVLADIATHGRTHVAIQPGPFVGDRLPAGRLEAFMASQVVRMRGWPVPYMDPRRPMLAFDRSVGQDVEPARVPHEEAWRICTSGQFLHRRVLASDLHDVSQIGIVRPEATGAVVVWDVLLYMVEVAELGVRLATTLDVPAIRFDVSLEGVSGRELVSGDWQRELHGSYIIQADRLSAELVVDSVSLLSEPRRYGVELAQSLLRKFGLDVADEVLRAWQEEVFTGYRG